MNLHEHAVNELSLIDDGSEEQQWVNKSIINIVDAFADQGHSGFSAKYSINLLSRLLNFYPIKPITDSEDEWGKWYGPEGKKSRQAKRYSALFQDEDGSVYDINRISKRYEGHMDSSWYGPSYYVKLPYLPNPDENYEVIVPKEFWPDDAPSPSTEDYASFTDDEELKKHILNKL